MHAVRRTLAAIPLLFLLAGATLDARGDESKGQPDAKQKASAPEAKNVLAQPAETKPPAPPTPPTTPPAPPAAEAAAAGAAPSSGKLTITLDGKTVTCREQGTQSFMVRGNWFPHTTDADKQKDARKLLEESIKYRTSQYGYFEGFGNPKGNAHPPKFYAKTISFMGMSVTVHEKIIPALKCVEAALKASPAGNEYHPHAMGGIRFKNTYRGVEVSNHVYGIAVDIEPDRNTCCGCVAPWNEVPLCKQKDKTVFQRMAMPKSWVDVFEKYGFYWLGHDVLQDTMHFEFLGEADKIVDNSTAIATQ